MLRGDQALFCREPPLEQMRAKDARRGLTKKARGNSVHQMKIEGLDYSHAGKGNICRGDPVRHIVTRQTIPKCWERNEADLRGNRFPELGHYHITLRGSKKKGGLVGGGEVFGLIWGKQKNQSGNRGWGRVDLFAAKGGSRSFR